MSDCVQSCSVCALSKPYEAFQKSSRTASGRALRCKSCTKTYMNAYRASHPELRDKQKARLKAHKEKPPVTSGDKKCTKCCAIKSITLFNLDSERPEGRDSVCSLCVNEERRVRWAENSESYNEKQRAYRHENPEKQRIWNNTAYSKTVPESRRTYHNHYRSLNTEAINAKRRLYMKEYRKNNPLMGKQSDAKRRARRNKAEGSFSQREFKNLCYKYGNICLACRCEKKLSADHVIPLAKQGTNRIDNIQPLCVSCNCKKHVKIIDYRPLFDKKDY